MNEGSSCGTSACHSPVMLLPVRLPQEAEGAVRVLHQIAEMEAEPQLAGATIIEPCPVLRGATGCGAQTSVCRMHRPFQHTQYCRASSLLCAGKTDSPRELMITLPGQSSQQPRDARHRLRAACGDGDPEEGGSPQLCTGHMPSMCSYSVHIYRLIYVFGWIVKETDRYTYHILNVCMHVCM